MKPILVFFSACVIAAANRATVQESTTEDAKKIERAFSGKQQWWNVLPPDNTSEKIGDGVSVYAHIIYDSNYTGVTNRRDKGNSEDVTDPDIPMEDYFKKLFEQVQQYFMNHSINVNFTIRTVSLMNNLSVFQGNWFDEMKTLKKVEDYGHSLAESNNTIFYFYTWTKHLFAAPFLTTGRHHSTSDVETSGTFCSAKTSAAVIRHYYTSLIYWTTVKSTAVIFGSTHFARFSPEDRKKMNQTFSRCPVHISKEPTEIPEIPSC
uniref:Putative 28 kDa metastriate family member n=1 Tax=Rhipicephalus pulchellus TaxID=72859 RepID=L7MBN4_RHIPC